MPSAADVLRRLWSTLDAETLAYEPYAPKLGDIPSVRTRKRLFPALFTTSRASGHLVKPVRDMPAELAALAEVEFGDKRPQLHDSVPWHQALVTAYRSHYMATRDAFLGEDSGPQLLPIGLRLAELHGRPAASEVTAVATERIRILSQLSRPLDARALTRAISLERSALDRAIDDAWTPPVPAAVVDAGGDVDDIPAQVVTIAREFALAQGDKFVVTDGETARAAWNELLGTVLVDERFPARYLGLTADRVPGCPSLDGAGRVAVLDLSIRSRITRLMHGVVDINVAPRLALDRTIAGSAGAYGLSDPASRLTMLLGEFASWSLSARDGNADVPAVTALWMREGIVEATISSDNPGWAKAQAFVDSPREYFLGRLWVRLFRLELDGRRIDDPSSAWAEVAGAVVSTRNEVLAMRKPAPVAPPAPPGGTDGDPSPAWDLVDSVLSYSLDANPRTAFLSRIARGDLGGLEPLWDEYCDAWVSAPSTEDSELVARPDLYGFTEMTRIVLQRLGLEKVVEP